MQKKIVLVSYTPTPTPTHTHIHTHTHTVCAPHTMAHSYRDVNLNKIGMKK
jgi:hypothetical protein